MWLFLYPMVETPDLNDNKVNILISRIMICEQGKHFDPEAKISALEIIWCCQLISDMAMTFNWFSWPSKNDKMHIGLFYDIYEKLWSPPKLYEMLG